MKWRMVIAAMAAMSAAFVPASAQVGACGDGAGLIGHLEKEWGEDIAALALEDRGGLVQILTNPETGTWSLLVTQPSGLTCLMMSGQAWEAIEPPSSTGSGPGDPS